jgi:hypothetical protein
MVFLPTTKKLFSYDTPLIAILWKEFAFYIQIELRKIFRNPISEPLEYTVLVRLAISMR